ncbi:MAG: contact-dependent growth inhibition system immunity protein [bacterium]|jgi:hypothetical protein
MSMDSPDTSKSLEQLEGKAWGPPEYDSHLVLECHRLHRVPLRDFTMADYRRMIGQNFCLEYLAPPALHFLEKEPFLEAEFYEGDLLCTLLTSEKKFWHSHKQLHAAAEKLAADAETRLAELSTSDERLYVTQAIAQFRKS